MVDDGPTSVLGQRLVFARCNIVDLSAQWFNLCTARPLCKYGLTLVLLGPYINGLTLVLLGHYVNTE